MSVAARYINRELLVVFAAVIAVLLIVALSGRFIGYLQEAAMGKYSPDSLFTIIWLSLAGFLQQLIPFAFYISLLVAIGRLHADHEMSVLQGSGVGPWRLVVWLLPVALPVAAIVGYLALEVTPRNYAELEGFFAEQRDRQEFDGIAPGVFRSLQGGKRVTYAESVSEDRQLLSNVFIAERDPVRPITIWAETGSQYVDADTGSHFLLLENGTRYEGGIGAKNYRVVTFGSLAQRLALSPRRTRSPAESQTTRVLLGNRSDGAHAELHWRIALPLMVIVGAMLGVGMSRVKPGQGRFGRVASGIMVFVAYYLLLVAIKDLVAEGDWSAWVGVWPVHVGFAFVALHLLRRVGLPASA